MKGDLYFIIIMLCWLYIALMFPATLPLWILLYFIRR